jgi:O-antigen ligase
MSIWIVIFIILFAALALYKLDWAVLLLIVALPAYLVRFTILGLPSTLLEAMILISGAVWCGKFFLPRARDLFTKRDKITPYPFSWEIILIIIVAFIAAGVAGFSRGSLGVWKAYFFEPILLFIMIFNIFPARKDLTRILWALIVSALGVSLLAIFQKITGLFITNPFWAAAATRRAVSWFGYPNAVGLYLAPLVMIFIGWLFSLTAQSNPELSKKKMASQKIIISLTILASLLAIYSARSEGALFGIAIALLIFGLLAGSRQRIITLALLAVVVVGTFWSAPTNNFILTKLTLHDLSGQIRLQQWKETLTMLGQGRIITGAGLDNYQNVIKPYHQAGIFFNFDNLPNFDSRVYGSATLRAKYWQPVEIYMYPHNIFLNFWSELGLVGALLFTWLIGKYLVVSLKLSAALGRDKNPEKYLVLGLATAMVAIVVHGLVDVPYFKNDLSAMFWLFLALAGALNLAYKNQGLKD